MCGRYTLVANQDQLDAEFDLIFSEPVSPNRNICPTQKSAVILMDPEAGGRVLRQMRWGLIPSWAKDPASSFKMINARSEEAAGKPAFREAFRMRRCLVPCTGFYEWKAVEGAPKARKQPFVFRLPDDRLFALGGLWERWHGPEGVMHSFTILTTTANQVVAPIHDRMPVIVAPTRYRDWLDPGLTDPSRIQQVLNQSPAQLESLDVDFV